MTAKHPRSKGPKRSLNGRKREKDVSRALLENCFRPEQVEFKVAGLVCCFVGGALAMVLAAPKA